MPCALCGGVDGARLVRFYVLDMVPPFSPDSIMTVRACRAPVAECPQGRPWSCEKCEPKMIGSFDRALIDASRDSLRTEWRAGVVYPPDYDPTLY